MNHFYLLLFQNMTQKTLVKFVTGATICHGKEVECKKLAQNQCEKGYQCNTTTPKKATYIRTQSKFPSHCVTY